MSGENKIVHFVAGALSGTLGSMVTCPLDVAKTRLQSSKVETYRKVDKPFENNIYNDITSNKISGMELKHQINKIGVKPGSLNHISKSRTFSPQLQKNVLTTAEIKRNQSVGLLKCIRYIVQAEGYRALFKGLLPTLVGVAPSRALYFTAYEYCKKTYSSSFEPQSSLIHLSSAASAGIFVTTATNPIWMIRTRLQLNNKSGTPYTTKQCIKQIYQKYGVMGFYKGLTASYFGVIETAIHFVIYEAIKAKIIENRSKKLKQSSPLSSSSCNLNSSSSSSLNTCFVDGDEDDIFEMDQEVLSPEVPPLEFLKYMLAASTSKTIATFIAYPHEVARTRMREGSDKYTKFFGTLVTVVKEEGNRALYRGLITQLIKHIPNTAIVLTTYEAVVYICRRKGL